MTNFTYSKKCGNAPRQEVIKAFNQAFADAETEKILDFVTQDFEWIMVGEETYKGKDQVTDALQQMEQNPPAAMHLEAIITHGNMASAHGTITDNDGKQYSFCDIYEFDGFKPDAKLARLQAFVIQTQ